MSGGQEPLPKPEQLKAKREREKWSPLDVPGACWKTIPFINLGWVASLVFFFPRHCAWLTTEWHRQLGG